MTDSISALCQRAYRLGSVDAYAGRPAHRMDDDGSAWLMTELGQAEPTTGANWDARMSMCDAYVDGYYDALSAMGGTDADYDDDGYDRSGVTDGLGHTYSDADPGL